MMTIGTANPAMTAAMSCAGVLIGAPCGASLMLVSSPWVCERYSATATSCSLSATDDYRRKISAAARGPGRCSAGVYPHRCGRRHGDGSGPERASKAVRWTVRLKPGILSVSRVGVASVLAGALSCKFAKVRGEAPVAQWIEYCPPKAGVAGSIPAGRAKPSKASSGFATSSFSPTTVKFQ